MPLLLSFVFEKSENAPTFFSQGVRL